MVDETEFDIMDAEENEELADCLSEAFGIEVNDMATLPPSVPRNPIYDWIPVK